MPLGHSTYIKQISLEHLSYIKVTSWNTSGRTYKVERSSPSIVDELRSTENAPCVWLAIPAIITVSLRVLKYVTRCVFEVTRYVIHVTRNLNYVTRFLS